MADPRERAIDLIVAKNVKIWLGRTGMKKKELAEKMGLAPPIISAILKGNKITMRNIALLADAFQIDPDLLFRK